MGLYWNCIASCSLHMECLRMYCATHLVALLFENQHYSIYDLVSEGLQ